MVERTTASGPRRTAFYFVQPPPLSALLGTTVERPSGLAAFRNPKRKARRDNVGYLGTDEPREEGRAQRVGSSGEDRRGARNFGAGPASRGELRESGRPATRAAYRD